MSAAAFCKRHARRIVRTLIVGAVAVVAIAAAGAPIYVFPPMKSPTRADVVDVIGPPTQPSLRIADELVRSGKVSALVITVTPPLYHPYAASDLSACHERRRVPVYCVTPNPFTTHGESRMLERLALQHQWSTAIVVTKTPHVARAQAIMNVCFPGQVDVISNGAHTDAGSWPFQYGYQTAGFAKFALELITEGSRYCD